MAILLTGSVLINWRFWFGLIAMFVAICLRRNQRLVDGALRAGRSSCRRQLDEFRSAMRLATTTKDYAPNPERKARY
jgi:hypothetical protein